MKKIFIMAIFIFSTFSFASRTEVCPAITPVMISPKLDVKVSYDKKTKNYIYKYKLTNLFTAKASIRKFSIESLAPPVTINTGKGWKSYGYIVENREILWGHAYLPDQKDYTIQPGQNLDGFEIISKSPPGPVRSYADGDSELPIIKFDTEEAARNGDHETIACPGFYRDPDINGGQVVIITTGPSIPNRIEAKIRLKRIKEKKWKGSQSEDSDLEISPLDSGKIQLILFGDKDVDVSKINLASLEFGRGKAKPAKAEIISEFKDDSDDEIKEHIKKIKNSHLLLEFNLQDVDVKCDIDHALFLTGKIGPKDLFGAAKIKHVGCDKKTFSKEAKKINEDGDSH